jgi:hypothetical protein
MESVEYQIVVARYNEDINYLSLFKDIMVVYNKGNSEVPSIFNSIRLPNVGRESHTYLYHIIQNYDNLANRTFFIQGRINDHKLLPIIEYFVPNNFVGKLVKNDISYIKTHIKHEGKYLKDLISGNMKRSKYTPYEWINKIGVDISKNKEFSMVWGAIFCVSKELILSRPKEFYQDIIKYVDYDINPEEGHFFERSWYLIFNHPTFNIKKKIYYYYNYNIDQKLIDICNKIIVDKNNEIEEIHLWTNNINNDYPLIYNKTHDYTEIKPILLNNSFSIEIKEELNLLIKINNTFIYEINIKKKEINMYTLNNNNEILSTIKNKNYNSSNEYNIYFYENGIIITNKTNNQILINSINNNLSNNDLINNNLNNYIINIYVKKSINIFNYDNKKIVQIYTKNNEIDQLFYQLYYEKYYKNDLTTLLISNNP